MQFSASDTMVLCIVKIGWCYGFISPFSSLNSRPEPLNVISVRKFCLWAKVYIFLDNYKSFDLNIMNHPKKCFSNYLKK
jgi:hypothetical protein